MDTLTEGKGIPFEIKLHSNDTYQIFIIMYEGELYGYENACSHFGVKLDVVDGYNFLVENQIVCQVHYAKYNPITGVCNQGECNGVALNKVIIEKNDSGVFLITD